jgi:A/G-specific adenine glycosylase
MPTQPFFTQKLLEWFATNHRPLPWKGEKNPYKIWLSEIILQQTTVRQGMPYYERFVAKYPTVKDLADAPEDDVMKLWEGLGYYSRARNLHATAKHITYALNASFPNTYDSILTLKGVGSYTAAAIASFAYDLPHAVVDGNVYRVLSRFFGIETPVDSTPAKKEFTGLANSLLDKNRPADFNQAMMDFGATQCTPNNPQCHICPLQSECRAFKKDRVFVLPIKSKKLIKKERFFNYLVINQGDVVYIRKRTGKDIWQDLYEFLLIETSELIENLENTEGVGYSEFPISNFKLLSKSQPYKQLLTHQKIIAVFWELEAPPQYFLDSQCFLKIEREKLTNFAFPKIIDTYMKIKVLNLF